MTRLAIKGHPTRGKEVIEILEMLGGKNDGSYRCDLADYAYSINGQGIIDWYIPHPNSPLVIFTLEEFLEKFPYKIGDRVRVPEYESDVRISNMHWDGYDVQYEVVTDEVEWYSAKELYEFFNEPYKKETVEEKNNDNWAKWDLPDGYEFQDEEGNVIKTGVIKLVKKQPQYPKTYEECCKVLNLTKYPPALVPNKATYINQYKDFPCYYEIQKLAELIVCRNAYWKIAGEQMGLGKPWEPDYTDDNVKYIIGVHRNNLDFNCTIERNYILIFPTEEMRDKFYENFKDLIEACKEFL